MRITRIDPDDAEAVAGYVAVRNAVSAVDAPWLHPMTPRGVAADLTVGWDGEPDVLYLGVEDGVP
ncbi:hypothetical protein ACKI1O_51525, partial [Streptomyces scabiei]